MKISELSPEYRQPPPHAGLLTDLNRVVADVEAFDTSDSSSPEKLAADLRRLLTNLASAASSSSGLDGAFRVKVWHLGFRLWNACVDRANHSFPPSRVAVAEAEIRQAAPELLLVAGLPEDIPNASAKAASFFHRTGLVWLDLGRADLASACFEKATPLVSAADTEGDRAVLLDLNLSRARVASIAGEQALAVALLSRSKPLAAGSPEGIKALAEEYLRIGQAALATKPPDPAIDASNLLTEALDLCEKAAASPTTPTTPGSTPATSNLQVIKDQCLRFLAVERLEANDYGGTLRCISVWRTSLGLGEEHPSIGFMALRACLGSGNLAEAERELETLMANARAPDFVCVSAAEMYLASTGPDAAFKVLVALAARCRAGAAGAAVRVLKKVVETAGGGTGRARAIAELASDERVVKLFDGPANSHERNTMHALLWTCGTEHFYAKNYDIGADLIERSMLYVSRDEESRSRRTNCFRVLCLCHMALRHLDRAQEFITEAEKVEPNIHCAFLKFKILLQKREEDEAIKLMKTMVGYVDFNPEFLTLSIHEAVACKSVRVAIAALTFLLGLYSAGKPMSMTEAAVLRNLVALLLREPGSEAEILKYSRRAKLRMAELGMEAVCGKGTVGLCERNWFAVNAWNMAIKMAKEKKYDYCTEFFELAAELFSKGNGEDDADCLLVSKSLIMSVSAMLHTEELNKSPLSDSDLKKGIEMLSRAGKLLSASVTSDQLEDNILPFLHTMNFYRLLNRMDTSAHPQQLQLVKNFAASKACTPCHLLILEQIASQGTQPNLLVAEFLLKASITTALASHSPNYGIISAAIRRLVRLAGLQDSSGSMSDAVYDVFQQAYQIVVGLRDGEYPFEEGKWLTATAWNKSGLASRLGQRSIAIKWMKMGIDLARHFESMKQYVSGMEEYFEHFQKVTGKEPDECSQKDGAPSTSFSGTRFCW
ncbi:TPR repeat-containing protein ZIP4-like isoform X2 [Panicum virgatum]|uniref:TPR repeat-containing protein ZIP4-like isoform X2 n=1 Tax=Panicum virgatum TaxID=38727 RepID=UPI0019D605FD|nr:TPR repeat-containing protein ZIP4-like isoform X2 [Panicum virgatum]XP_039850315.1 TPR repeat-containing protein ZIP4-like isoform X2 [Panicum virgatum]XP_039850316.1 TPR repeat-containing protein ZIP4-like isoform X2 [Panicum virgatum]XP_039850317.1 TPR repeat-containing protein ZIP4-like isoform X2 [Panicum virgatum]XP_039850318.1 TPR repeat-containing protein ZIP4-like isoform X2 [Panicum virgatum]XP_039850319.1 TPR repeat-containing protein ZIP4-like isoform X2 [Panicum virgatum]XP_03